MRFTTGGEFWGKLLCNAGFKNLQLAFASVPPHPTLRLRMAHGVLGMNAQSTSFTSDPWMRRLTNKSYLGPWPNRAK